MRLILIIRILSFSESSLIEYIYNPIHMSNETMMALWRIEAVGTIIGEERGISSLDLLFVLYLLRCVSVILSCF